MPNMRRTLAVLVALAAPLIYLGAQSGVGGGGQSNVSGGGGTASPSSLSNFFNGFMGLSPKDCGNAACTTPGAKGDGRITFDGAAAVGSPNTVTSGGLANFTAADVGKVIELTGAGNLGSANVLQTTITSINSTTSVQIAGTVLNTVSAQRLLIATDDTAALQNWVNNVNTVGSVHGGYLPKGVYYTTQPLRFVGTVSLTNTECSGSPNGANFILACSLWIQGAGASESIIEMATAGIFNWATPSTSVNNGAIFISNYAFYTVSQLTVQADTSNYNLTGNTGIDGMVVVDGSCTNCQTTHGVITNVGVWRGGSTDGVNHPLYGILSLTANGGNGIGDFESYYGPAIQAEGGDINVGLCINTTTNLCEKITLDTVWVETGARAGVVIGSSSGTTTVKQLRIRNMHELVCAGGGLGGFDIRASVTTAEAEQILFEGVRFGTGSATCNGPFLVVESGATPTIELDGTDFNNAQTSGAQELWVKGAGVTVRMNGGGFFQGVGGNTIQNDSASSNIYLMNTSIFQGNQPNGTGSAHVFSFQPTTSGWKGGGVNEGTTWVSDQGTACTNGELALSAGWQSTGSATVTAVAGVSQTCSWTITTGTTTAANPTVTDTLTNVLPTATTVCEMNIHGGTHTAAAGEGFQQTTLSATAPIFTFNGTPTAGGTTYFVTRRCGP